MATATATAVCAVTARVRVRVRVRVLPLTTPTCVVCCASDPVSCAVDAAIGERYAVEGAVAALCRRMDRFSLCRPSALPTTAWPRPTWGRPSWCAAAAEPGQSESAAAAVGGPGMHRRKRQRRALPAAPCSDAEGAGVDRGAAFLAALAQRTTSTAVFRRRQ
jgi:hypothetical protein